jgi:DNA topoisomerase I
MERLVIVESPTKARTIRSFLPDGYRVESSLGHIRDLPSSAAEIPASRKGRDWARMGVDVEHDFEPLYVIPAAKKKTVAALKKLVKEADELLLATDEDREGESIGWHLVEVLKPAGPVRRMVFHEITAKAIKNALAAPRDLDLNLVRAQEARRILDRLVGYTLSPLLWKKIAPRLSAGRVQSVAVRLLVNRERKRRDFHPAVFLSLKALLNKRPDLPAHRFEAQLHSLGGKILATGKDFDPAIGKLASGKDRLLLTEAEAAELVENLKNENWRVSDLQEKSTVRNPYPPFTTATLQIEASRKLGLATGRAMKIAQKLYENGYITYMRTDSVHLSEEAITAARRRIAGLYGKEFLNPQPRRYRTREKGAQEAHEAIRPAGREMRPPSSLPLSGPEASLYDLIWKRTIATQMKPARLRFQTVSIAAGEALFKANGRIVDFPGFFKAYTRGTDRPDEKPVDRSDQLPPLEIGEEVDCRGLESRSGETKPPHRYTEAELVKVLKDEGIGRPSTYASIINTIITRGYVFRQARELVPTFTAFSVTRLLEEHFSDLVDVKFTAGMEDQLDNIARGDQGWLEYLRRFYLGEDGLQDRVRVKEGEVDPRELFAFKIDDPPAEVRIGRFGPFLAWEKDGEAVRASIPPAIPPAELTGELARRLMIQKEEGPRKLADDPETGLAVYLKLGPFGAYVQRGENGAGQEKPKRIKLPAEIPFDEVTPETALRLLQLPRTLGVHPETGKPVKAGLGRFGPYLLHDGNFTSLKKPHNVLEVTLEEALEIMDRAQSQRAKGGKKALKKLGKHPGDDKPVRIMNGRFGPYLNHGRTNVSLNRETDLEGISLTDAITRLEAKAAKKKKKPAPTKKKKRPAGKKQVGKNPAKQSAEPDG